MSLLEIDLQLTRHSYYAATAARREVHAPLEAAIECDVAVVGGGLAGLSAAIELADRGFAVALLEAHEIGWGASGRNGGQAIAGLACDQAVIERQLGAAASRAVWDMTIEALRLIAERIDRFGIACEWQPGFLSLAVNARKARDLHAWHLHMAHAYDHRTTWIEPARLPDWIASPRFHAGVHDPHGGHLHPLKYCLGLGRAAAGLGVKMFEHTPVTAVEPGGGAVRVRSARGSVRASYALLAGNVYLDGLAPQLQARVMPVGTYIVASEPLDPALCASLIPSRAAVCDTNFVLDYFRPTADHRMLYGGRVSYSTATPPNLAASMQRRMARTFPQLKETKVDFSWGGFVDVSMNRAPDFGRLPGAANVYYLQGFSGHGLALTGLAGRLVAEAIDGDAGRFDTFAKIRHRPFPGGRLLRTPALVAGMAYYRLRDLL